MEHAGTFSAGGGGWEKVLIRNVCYREPYDHIPRELMPSAHRSAYYAAKRDFYARVKVARENS